MKAALSGFIVVIGVTLSCAAFAATWRVSLGCADNDKTFVSSVSNAENEDKAIEMAFYSASRVGFCGGNTNRFQIISSTKQ